MSRYEKTSHLSLASLLWSTLFLLINEPGTSAQEPLITADQSVNSSSPYSSWWFASIKRQGVVAYRSDTGYPLYRNVKDYGAIGDGVANDTDALIAAISDGPRCLGQYHPTDPCESTTIRPALVYVPPGTYLVSSRLIIHYNTLLYGDVFDPPTIKAYPEFDGLAVLDTDVYYPGGASWYANQNNFFRQIRNLIIDITDMPLTGGNCLHYQIAQATSLQNLVFKMRIGGGEENKQRGIFMDNGSGGFMRDLVFIGGGQAFLLGNQQFTSTNLTFYHCHTAVFMNWDWIWLFKDIKVINCTIGIDMTQHPEPALGNALVMDSTFINVTTGIRTSFNCTNSRPPSAGSLMVDNCDFTGAQNAIAFSNGTAIVPGGRNITFYMQGHTYSAHYGVKPLDQFPNQTCYAPLAELVCVQGEVSPIPKPIGLWDEEGRLFDRAKPAYDDWPLSKFVSVKDNGCVGDGVTDDTACFQRLFNAVTTDQILYIDHGAYVITDTVFVPEGVKVVGEAWPKIMIASSDVWANPSDPVPAFRVGDKGDVGTAELQDIVFQTRGPTPGAILMEWNLEEDAKGSAGMWDVHWRLGGSMGTLLQMDTCEKDPSRIIEVPKAECYVSFLILHITNTSSLYMENNWGWVSDHELDYTPSNQIDIWQGRGLLVESTKPVWIVGGSFEHSQLYNYQTTDARNVWIGHVQSETAYMQENPIATLAFPPNATWNDPFFTHCWTDKCIKTFGLRMVRSNYVYFYGTGLYSFFQNYDQTCLLTESCQYFSTEIVESQAIYVFALYSIGHLYLVLMDGFPLIPQGDNMNTFGQSVILFEHGLS